MAILILIIGLILFVILIVVHEFGHFIVARRNGVVAEEFAIFFGPTLYEREMRNGAIFRFNSIPVGGYVKLKGEHDSDTEPGSYGAASLWIKTKIMAAGVVINLVFGVLLLMLVALIGLPQVIPNQFSVKSDAHVVQSSSTVVPIEQIISGSPAARAGLKSNDEISAIGPKGEVEKVTSISGLQSVTQKFAGQFVSIDYIRDNKHLVGYTTLNSRAAVDNSTKKHPVYYLGVMLDSTAQTASVIRYTWSAPIVAVGLSKQVIVLTGQGLGHALKGLGGIVAGTATVNKQARENAQTNASNQVVGPVGIFIILKDGSAIGIQFMLFIVAIISLTLGLMNILPIPALDGGRLWLTLIAHLIKKPLNARTEEMVNAIGMIVLCLLLCVITYVDIKRFT